MRNIIIPTLAAIAILGTGTMALADSLQEPAAVGQIEIIRPESNQVHTDMMFEGNVYGGLY